MVVQEYKDGFWHSYSDKNVYIHGGYPEGDYTEAYDPIQRNYIETGIAIETAEEIDEYAIAGRILMGVIE